ncbi:bifunctional serine/threonine-protein kinase/universal stress protein [Roseomonas sp. CECT 9278]|uniref:serine/threonine protein kinase n=1 Tax=Roseomonas sp. CECT 9278 TaxID=2845823 RepID=UPI001E3A9436|nr:bifunctional serine/threonine-protein kinase/universal stress protein [Roseomonas sp. CECT 9278]CAH0308494.1 Serine/threonine-protein kinase PknD [Roseomonas sp. CECT 9278]
MPLTGRVIDGFAIGEVLHEGGMALLHRASHPNEASALLMKVPRLRAGEDPAAIVSFEMEQMIMPRLAGPHVPRFVAMAGFEAEPYIVMERIEGTALSERLRDLPLPIDDVAAIGAAVADALDDLHHQHVVHLDVKPANILFRPDGTAVLVDFGLAHHDQLPDLMAEEFRLPYGSTPYMAPEQLLGVRHDPRSDLFALGALMYQLATGETPFGEPRHLKGVKRRLWRDPVPPRRRRDAMPPWLQEVILRCLEVNPDRRHPTAAQLAFDLRHPDQIALTARAERRRRDDLITVLRRRLRPEPLAPRQLGAAGRIAAAPILAVAIDLSQTSDDLAGMLRNQVQKMLGTRPGARLACLNVLREAAASAEDAAARNRHVQRLVELRHWAAPLRLAEGRVTFHVLEAPDAAEAILDYARANRVDHLVVGARENSLSRRLLGSVSGQVAGEAPCSVTVVRRRRVG